MDRAPARPSRHRQGYAPGPCVRPPDHVRRPSREGQTNSEASDQRAPIITLELEGAPRMAVSRVPGSRKLFDYARLQAHRKRRGRNPRLEALEDRVQPQSLYFIATPVFLAIPATVTLVEPQAAVQRSAHATARSIATTAIASVPVAAHRDVHGSAAQHSPALVQAAAPHPQRLAAAHLTSRATHHAPMPTGHRTQVNAQPAARAGGAAVSAPGGGRVRSRR